MPIPADTEVPKRIYLKSGYGAFEEGYAAGAITPGHLIKLTTDVGTDNEKKGRQLIVHGTVGGPAERAFALEDALQGKTIDDAYASGDLVFYILAEPGDVVYAWLDAGESVTPADFLQSAGNGRLEKVTGSNARLAVPLETVVNNESGDVPVRIRVRLL